MITTKQKRRKQYKRESASVNIRLTQRDIKIIHLVWKYRFINSEHIISLIDGGEQGINRRLKNLFHAGYLDRPKAQVLKFGKRPMVYALGNKGADILAEELDMPRQAVDWTNKNREVKGIFLDHTLMITNFLVMVQAACKNIQGVEFIDLEEIINNRPILPKSKDKELSWQVQLNKIQIGKNYTEFKKNIVFSIFPDGAFGLRFPGAKKNLQEIYFFIEADRSSMPISIPRNNIFRSSFFKKITGYWNSWKQELFLKNFGFKNPRLLTITISKQRIESMIKSNKALDPRGQGLRMFLFAPEQAFNLKNPAKIFEKIWINGRGEQTSIID